MCPHSPSALCPLPSSFCILPSDFFLLPSASFASDRMRPHAVACARIHGRTLPHSPKAAADRRLSPRGSMRASTPTPTASRPVQAGKIPFTSLWKKEGGRRAEGSTPQSRRGRTRAATAPLSGEPFMVPLCTLPPPHSTLHTPHSTFHTPHSTLIQTPLFPFPSACAIIIKS